MNGAASGGRILSYLTVSSNVDLLVPRSQEKGLAGMAAVGIPQALLLFTHPV
jgi:hypothetical protein